ncbi:MAG TPA: proline iminopeptidase-family hydrolase [Acidimicrobiales bacterium]|nr:proline iminopeptidase-family hydrolase [Acidimicrobiales bacterium]
MTEKYNDRSNRPDVAAGGVKMIPITTPLGIFNVWTKRIGNNPALKVLLLHGGPGGTHDAFEVFDSFLPAAGVEYYYYDQLGSGRSDIPTDSSLWDLNRFIDEVEQVRIALDLGPSNFVLLGHSWGGILAMEYSLKHGGQLKGLVVSNMMSSVPAYNRYATDILMPAMNQDDLAEIQEIEAAEDFANPRYMELLVRSYYVDHILRINPVPEPVRYSFAHLNHDVYLLMQGPSELGIHREAILADWDRTSDLEHIAVPTLVLGGRHDTMDPTFLEMMATRIPRGSSYICENGSHFAMYDDQDAYFSALLSFLSRL